MHGVCYTAQLAFYGIYNTSFVFDPPTQNSMNEYTVATYMFCVFKEKKVVLMVLEPETQLVYFLFSHTGMNMYIHIHHTYLHTLFV